MAQQEAVRWVSRRGEDFDRFIVDQMEQVGFGVECHYYGIEDPGRASDVRRGLRRAGQHVGVAVKAYSRDCSGCQEGGPRCRYHILFTSYSMEDARAYMAAKAAALQWGGEK